MQVRHVETIPEWREGDKREFNYDILINGKKFCKCHRVTPVQK
jgi:hypothetical protein